jgi:hypothetical protein
MAQPSTPYRSAFRGLRTVAKPPQPPSVSSPVGATTSTTAGDQAKAIRSDYPSEGLFESLGRDQQEALRGAYQTGGFEGVAKTKDWYDLPEYVRTQILAGVRE